MAKIKLKKDSGIQGNPTKKEAYEYAMSKQLASRGEKKPTQQVLRMALAKDSQKKGAENISKHQSHTLMGLKSQKK